jgi:phosphatidylglycerophosphate synthase
MLTLMGVAFLFSGVVVAYLIDNTLNQEISHFVRIYYAFCIYMALTFDAIDGKHARRTNRCSPLGQLMDHSMDCLSNSFTLIMIASAFRFGSSAHTLLILIHFQVII